VRGARTVLRRVLTWGVGSGVVVALTLLVARPALARAFTPDPAVHLVLDPTLVVLALVIPVGAVVFMLDGVLIGAGDARYLALANTIATAVHVPFVVAVVMSGGGLPSLWAAYGVWILARGVTLGVRARSDAWLVTG
jgi:Na+-driven multidrug efflux pump